MLDNTPSTAILILLLMGGLRSAPVLGAGQAAPQSGQTATMGRVVATVTTLEGTVHVPAVQVELRDFADRLVIARTVSDGSGQVSFPDVPAGRYVVTATGPGFVPRDSPVFEVRAGGVAEVLLDMHLTFVMPDVEVGANAPPRPDSVQPVSMSDMLSGSVLETAPLEGDDFQSLLPLLPGVVRGADGRLRIKGGQPTQGALQIRSASLIDPSSGEFDLDLPAQSVESVEVLANPFAAEYGRFTTSITQVQTRRGTNEWELSRGNLVPRFRKWLSGIRGFEPQLSVRGPFKRDRVFVAQDLQFRYVATPVKSLPGEPEIDLRSFDSFTRVDSVVSARHTLGGGVILFPREIRRATMSTFRPPEVTPDFNQNGWSAGLVDRFALTPDLVLESTLSAREFEIEVGAAGGGPMVYAPESQRGSFFSDQERDVTSLQWVQAASLSREIWGSQHVFKAGTDLQRSRFSGASFSRPVEARRLDGSLAERIEFGGRSRQQVEGTELAVFAQDRWRLNSRVTLEAGLRLDRDAVVERVNFSPRAGLAIAVLEGGRGIARGGFGKFVQRTPLNVGAFPTFESRTVSRFSATGQQLGTPRLLTNRIDGDLRTPEAFVGNLEWHQRFGRRALVKLAYLHRDGDHEFILAPDPASGQLRLSSTGTSRYRELEATVRYLGGESRDLTVSYVRSKGTADLNHYDQFFGNFRNPLVRANEHNLTSTDVPHRLLIRGTIGLPGKWSFAPVAELRSGFPWSAINEFQDFVGPRNRTGRLPAVRTLDFSLSRPWQFKKYRFRAGVKLYNALGSSAARDIQNNLTAPDYGASYNPIERSIGFVFASVS
ncbi:MAG: hypothetical protein GEU82_05510 [Luteitalea sp.]|nr:hypothetical protein [Luteitalea sp.]